MKILGDETCTAIRARFDPAIGFCSLCWQRTEANLANDKIFVKRKGAFIEVQRPALTVETYQAAKRRLAEIKKAAQDGDMYLYGRLLYAYAHGYDHRTLQKHGFGSQVADEMLVDIIERNLIDDRWLNDHPSFVLLRKQYEKRIPLGERAISGTPREPLKASTTLCAEHNPRRSVEARRRYQNDLRRKDKFDALIRTLFTYSIHRGQGVHTEADWTELRKQAYALARMTTLEMVKTLQTHGVDNLAEIGRLLGVTRQAVFMALARERKPAREELASSL